MPSRDRAGTVAPVLRVVFAEGRARPARIEKQLDRT